MLSCFTLTVTYKYQLRLRRCRRAAPLIRKTTSEIPVSMSQKQAGSPSDIGIAHGDNSERKAYKLTRRPWRHDLWILPGVSVIGTRVSYLRYVERCLTDIKIQTVQSCGVVEKCTTSRTCVGSLTAFLDSEASRLSSLT